MFFPSNSLLLASGADPLAMDDNNLTPLEVAVRADSPFELIVMLLQKPKPNVRGRSRSDGNSILHVAASRNDRHLAHAILHFGGDMKALNNQRQSPMDVALGCNASGRAPHNIL